MDRVWSRRVAFAGALIWSASAAAGCGGRKAGKAPARNATLMAPADAGQTVSTSSSSSALAMTAVIDAGGDPYHAAGESIAVLDRRMGEIKSHAPSYYELSKGKRAELKALMQAKAKMLHTTLSKRPKPGDGVEPPARPWAAGKDGGAP